MLTRARSTLGTLLLPDGSEAPENVEARRDELLRLIPLVLFIQTANSLLLAANFFGSAPVWLVLAAPTGLVLLDAAYLAGGFRTDGTLMPSGTIHRRRNPIDLVIAALPVCLAAWATAFCFYGDMLERSHLAFYMMASMLGFAFCLVHLPPSILIVTVLATVVFAGVFAATGEMTFATIGLNIAIIAVPVVVIVLRQKRDFERMAVAQADASTLTTRIRREEREQSRLLRMIDDMPVAVMTVDPTTLEIDYVNETSKRTLRQIEHLLPIKVNDIIGTSIDVFHKHPEHQRGILEDPANLPHRARIRLGPEVLDLQVSAVTADDGSYLGPMLSWAIVTKEVQAESRMLQLAQYDTLTGLANRNTFNERLAASLSGADKSLGLLFIDLDDFKLVNDSWGHRFGDLLLKQVADRMDEHLDGPDMTIARLGGDEFALLVRHPRLDQLSALADAVIQALSTPFQLEHERHVRIGASVGIARAPAHGEDAGTLLARADIALNFAKAEGKGRWMVFEPTMERKIQDQVRLEAKLRIALEREEGLFVFYQPIIDIQTGRITSREALIRWYHPSRGWISPGEFVPIAEQSGLADSLGSLVLDRACRDAAGWSDGERVAVNISAGQLGNGTLPSMVRAALARSGLAPDRLEIEVTETALINNESGFVSDLRALHDFGVRVSLDDFGTGYSSLAHLRVFPFDTIKIDMSFVHDAINRPDCAAVIAAVADLGNRLGVTTIAEGVETKEQLELITREGCTEAQGFFFSIPMPSDADAANVEDINCSLHRATANRGR